MHRVLSFAWAQAYMLAWSLRKFTHLCSTANRSMNHAKCSYVVFHLYYILPNVVKPKIAAVNDSYPSINKGTTRD